MGNNSLFPMKLYSKMFVASSPKDILYELFNLNRVISISDSKELYTVSWSEKTSFAFSTFPWIDGQIENTTVDLINVLSFCGKISTGSLFAITSPNDTLNLSSYQQIVRNVSKENKINTVRLDLDGLLDDTQGIFTELGFSYLEHQIDSLITFTTPLSKNDNYFRESFNTERSKGAITNSVGMIINESPVVLKSDGNIIIKNIGIEQNNLPNLYRVIFNMCGTVE